ncbi:unnamed protein product, partial [Prorocentrum cordatum]
VKMTSPAQRLRGQGCLLPPGSRAEQPGVVVEMGQDGAAGNDPMGLAVYFSLRKAYGLASMAMPVGRYGMNDMGDDFDANSGAKTAEGTAGLTCCRKALRSTRALEAVASNVAVSLHASMTLVDVVDYWNEPLHLWMETQGGDMNTDDDRVAKHRETRGGDLNERVVKWYKVPGLCHILGLGHGRAAEEVSEAAEKFKCWLRLPKIPGPDNISFNPNVAGLLTTFLFKPDCAVQWGGAMFSDDIWRASWVKVASGHAPRIRGPHCDGGIGYAYLVIRDHECTFRMPGPRVTADQRAKLAGQWAQKATDKLWRNLPTVTLEDAFAYLADPRYGPHERRDGDWQVRRRIGRLPNIDAADIANEKGKFLLAGEMLYYADKQMSPCRGKTHAELMDHLRTYPSLWNLGEHYVDDGTRRPEWVHDACPCISGSGVAKTRVIYAARQWWIALRMQRGCGRRTTPRDPQWTAKLRINPKPERGFPDVTKPSSYTMGIIFQGRLCPEWRGEGAADAVARRGISIGFVFGPRGNAAIAQTVATPTVEGLAPDYAGQGILVAQGAASASDMAADAVDGTASGGRVAGAASGPAASGRPVAGPASSSWATADGVAADGAGGRCRVGSVYFVGGAAGDSGASPARARPAIADAGDWNEHVVKWYKVPGLCHILGLGHDCAAKEVSEATEKFKCQLRWLRTKDYTPSDPQWRNALGINPKPILHGNHFSPSMLRGPADPGQVIPVRDLRSGLWKGAELFAQCLAFSQAVPPCPDCRLVCPALSCPAPNLSCPRSVAPNLTCQAPLVQLACPEGHQAPSINLSCPVAYPLPAEGGFLGYDLPSLTVGVLVGSVGSAGDWVLMRYDLPGPEVWHERPITGASAAQPSLVSTVTNDGDHYAEDLSEQNDDIAEVRWIGQPGDTPVGVDGRRIYRFQNPPDAATFEQLKRDGALIVGGRVAAPAAAEEPEWQESRGAQVLLFPRRLLARCGSRLRTATDSLVGTCSPTRSPTARRHGASVRVRRRLARRRTLEAECNEVIEGLNMLHSPAQRRSAPNAAQRESHRAIFSEVKAAPRASAVYARREAARELLTSSLSYTGDEAKSPVVQYDRSRVDIPRVGSAVPRVETVIDPVGREYLLHFETRMLRSADEWDQIVETEPPIAPCMDDYLRRHQGAYITSVGDLVAAGNLKDIVTPFFVAKKNGQQRLVWDARVPNRRFRHAPPQSMGTSAACGRIDLGCVADDSGKFKDTLYCAQADIRNYFYMLGLSEEVGLFFSLPPVPEARLSQWGRSAVGSPQVDRGGWVWPFLAVVPMGWNWAFWPGQRCNVFRCLQASSLGPERLLTDSYGDAMEINMGHRLGKQLDVFGDVNTVSLEFLKGELWSEVFAAPFHVSEPIPVFEARASDAGSRHILRSFRAFNKRHLKLGRSFEGSSREERATRRVTASGEFHRAQEGAQSFLEVNAVVPATQDIYLDCMLELKRFVVAHGLSLGTPAEADLALTSFANYAWTEGLDRGVVHRTCAAFLSEHPDFSWRGALRLPSLSRAMQGWERLDPGLTRPPIPWILTCLIAQIMIVNLKVRMAALVVLTMFMAYLRQSEAENVLEEELVPPSASSGSFVLNLHHSDGGEVGKVRLSDESIMLDSVEAEWLGDLLRAVESGLPRRPLFRLTVLQLRIFWSTLKIFDIPNEYALYQLRHGARRQRPGPPQAQGPPRRFGPPPGLCSDIPPPFVELMRGSASLSSAVGRRGLAAEGWDYIDGARADLADTTSASDMAADTADGIASSGHVTSAAGGPATPGRTTAEGVAADGAGGRCHVGPVYFVGGATGDGGAPAAFARPAIADTGKGSESEFSIHVVTAGVVLAADYFMLARGLTTRMAELVNVAVALHTEHWSFAQTCAAYSALIEMGGLRARLVGQNIFDYARYIADACKVCVEVDTSSGDSPRGGHACTDDEKQRGAKPARPKRSECIVNRVPYSEDGLRHWANLEFEPFLPLSLKDTSRLPVMTCVGVDPARFADWKTDQGAALRLLWEDVPRYILPHDNRLGPVEGAGPQQGQPVSKKAPGMVDLDAPDQEEDDADAEVHILPLMARVPLMFRACKGHSVRVMDPMHMCIRCEAAARYSYPAIVIPLDDAAMERSMPGYLETPKNDLQGIRQHCFSTCLPTSLVYPELGSGCVDFVKQNYELHRLPHEDIGTKDIEPLTRLKAAIAAGMEEYWPQAEFRRAPVPIARPTYAGAPADYVGAGAPACEPSAKGDKRPRSAKPEGRPKAARAGGDVAGKGGDNESSGKGSKR